MHNKLYSFFYKIKKEITKYLKQNYKILIVYLIILSMFLIPTNYQVQTPGSLLDVSKRVQIENNEEEKEGSFNITFVRSRGSSVALVLLSYIVPSWDLESKNAITLPKEEYEQAEQRNKIDLEISNQTATLIAYQKAKKYVDIEDVKVLVTYVLNEETSKLKVGDEIIKMDNLVINNATQLQNYTKNKKVNDKVKLTIKRKNKIKILNSTLISCKREPCLGIYIEESYKLNTNPKIKIEYKENESGSSAGLMTSLYIYDSLVQDDLTKNFKISGTGTIEKNGSVGQIDGVKYKLIGAVKKDADVFICPKENYKEALKIKKEKNYDIKIIKASNFDQVINSLKKL